MHQTAPPKCLGRLPLLRWAFFLVVICCNIAATAADRPSAAEAKVELLLNAVGGREAWSATRGTINDSQQYRIDAPSEVRAVITMDFKVPRFRIETTAPGLHLIRVIDGENDWRLSRDGTIQSLPAATREGDLRWYAGHLYRTIHRVAANDPALSARMNPDGRLEIVEAGERIMWFRMTSAGEPYAYGSHDDGAGSRCGPWKATANGIRHPIWTANAEGTWRASLNTFSVLHSFDERVLKPVGGSKSQITAPVKSEK